MKVPALAIAALHVLLASVAWSQQEPTLAEREFATSLIANTSQSNSAASILVATMFAQQYQPDSMPTLLAIELGTTEYNTLRYSLAAYYCLAGGTASVCNIASFGHELINLDQDNLEPYLYTMVKLAEAGNPEAALAALTRGNLAVDTNNYYFDKLQLLRASLAGAQYPQDKINGASESLAGAALMYGFYAKVLSLCAELSQENASWKSQCLALGSRFENEGRTAMQYIFGLALQRDCLGASALENAQRAAVLARRDSFNAIRDQAGEKLDWWLDVSLKSDALYQRMAEQGEIFVVQKALEGLE